jgi:ribose/xylose/arabinose/galactoside ABC-type transport system permease subunit
MNGDSGAMKERESPRPALSPRTVSGPMLGLLALLALFVFLLYLKGQLGSFFSLGNAQVLLHKSSITAVLALGMLLIIVSGGIDLSVGSVVALVTVVTMQVYRFVYNGPEYVLPSFLPESWVEVLRARGLFWRGTGSTALASLAAVPAGLLVGAACGLCNGLVITRLRLAPFVATLGMLSVARGLAYWLAGRTRVSFRGPRPDWVDALSRTSSKYLVFDPGVWSVLLLAAVVFVLLRYTVFGRYVYAIGSNEATARLCGMAIERNKTAIYALAGLLAGWAGVLLFAHINGGDPNAAVGLELDVIAAVVIGGASLAGGQGAVGGTLLGVLILGVLENGVSIFDVPVEVKYVLIGVIVVVNTALSGWQRRRQGE